MYKRLLTAVTSLLPLISFSQLLLNTGFEDRAKDGFAKYWQRGSAQKNGFVLIDTSIAHTKKRSVKVSLQHPNAVDTLAYTFNTINTSRLPAIKKIVVSAWVKVDRVTAPSAFILLNDDDRILTSRCFANVHQKGRWQRLVIVRELSGPQKIYQIYIAACVRKGTAWFDDFSVTIDGVVAEQKKKTPFTHQDQQWVDHHLTPAEKSTGTFFAKLSKVVAGRYLLGVGEPTHGTKEAYAFKIGLFKTLVLQHNYRIIVLENGMAETYKINQYINAEYSSARTPAKQELKKYLNSFLSTSEIIDFIEWMRAYNLTHTDKISCIGMDIQTYGQCIINIKELLRTSGLSCFTNDAEAIGSAIQNLTSRTFDDTAQRQAALKMIDSLSQACKRRLEPSNAQDPQDTSILQGASIPQDTSISWLYQHFDLLRDFLWEDKARWDNYSMRTQFMYDNILWFLKDHRIEKTLIWAHNGHINKMKGAQSTLQRQGSLGHFLKAGFGDEYYCLGVYTGGGTYSARISGSDNRWRIFPLEAPGRNTVEHYLSLATPDAYFLDLSKTDDIGLPAFLTQDILQRSGGMIYDRNQFYSMGEVAGLYDGVYFVRHSTSTRVTDSQDDVFKQAAPAVRSKK